jgi:hypothetical protein
MKDKRRIVKKRKKNNPKKIERKVNCKLIMEILNESSKPINSREITFLVNKKIENGQVSYNKFDYKTKLGSFIYGQLNNLTRSKKVKKIKDKGPYKFYLPKSDNRPLNTHQAVKRKEIKAPKSKPKYINQNIDDDIFSFMDDQEIENNQEVKDSQNIDDIFSFLDEEKDEQNIDEELLPFLNNLFQEDNNLKAKQNMDEIISLLEITKEEKKYEFLLDYDYDERLPDPFIYKIEDCIL